MANIIQNVSGGIIDIDDLGITLEIGETTDLSTRFDQLDVATTMESGQELYNLILAGSIVVKDPIDGVSNLSPINGVANLQSVNDTNWRVGGGARAEDIAFTPVADNSETVLQDAVAENSGKMEWKKLWIATEYDKDDVVRDGDWTMIANKLTTDRAAPTPFEEPEFILPDTPTWSPGSDLSVISLSHTYTISLDGWVPAIRIWPDKVSPTYEYQLRIENLSDPANPITRDIPISSDVLTEGQWNDVQTSSSIAQAGAIIKFTLSCHNSSSNTFFNGDWTFDSQSGGNSNPSDPAAESWSTNGQFNKLKIDKDDLTSTDRSLDLLSVVPISIIKLTESGDTTKSVTLRVEDAPDNQITYVEYEVTKIGEGINGTPTEGQATSLNFIIPVPANTEYIEQANTWNQPLPDFVSSVTSELEYDGVDQGASVNTAYGIDFLFQRALVSDDWDLVATSQISSGSTGGGTGTDELVKVSSNDTVGDYLDSKLVAGTGITLTENNDGANETLTIAASGGGATVGVSDEGVLVPNSPFSVIDFVGAGVTATDGGAGVATVTIPGGGGACPGNLPFFNQDTTQDNIALIGSLIPFFNQDTTYDPINVVCP